MKKLLFGNSLMLLALMIMVMCDLEVLSAYCFWGAVFVGLVGFIMCIMGFFFDDERDCNGE